MSFRLGSVVRLCIPAILLPLVACGPARNAFAPQCPAVRLIPTVADVSRYKGPGPAHDITDLILQGRIIAVNGVCQPGEEPNQLAAKAQVSISLLRGPAMAGRDADVPVFLAVTEGDTIRDKKVFQVHLTFPPNVDRMTITSPDIDMLMPVSASANGASYGIITGFQLTPEELAANRRAGGG